MPKKPWKPSELSFPVAMNIPHCQLLIYPSHLNTTTIRLCQDHPSTAGELHLMCNSTFSMHPLGGKPTSGDAEVRGQCAYRSGEAGRLDRSKYEHKKSKTGRYAH